MNPEQARQILENWMSVNKIVTLPIVDQVIITLQDDPLNSREVSDWTFKGLIKIAYNLTDK